MNFLFEFRTYHRAFRHPLKTHHGSWSTRSGIILKLTDPAGNFSYGEIAPVEWFGSETFERALAFCQDHSLKITSEEILQIPATLPATQFGFESAYLGFSSHQRQPFSISGLLPAGSDSHQAWQVLWKKGFRTFKWKIGVDPIAVERLVFEQLCSQLPTGSKLRLDANGGLNIADAQEWLQVCDQADIEYLEQPLAIDQVNQLILLSQTYQTPIALDESVATFKQLKAWDQKDWQGIYVIKPSLIGSVTKFCQFCQERTLDLVFSSVFETSVGTYHAAQLAQKLSTGSRAMGFGVHHFLGDDGLNHPDLFPSDPQQVRAYFNSVWTLLNAY